MMVGHHSGRLVSRVAVLLLCASIVAGRSWNAPRPSKDLYTNVLLTKSSAAVVYIKAYLDGDRLVDLDPSDVSFTVDFGTNIGTPAEEYCEHLHCVSWTARDGSRAAELVVKLADDQYALSTSNNPQKLQVAVKGPAHRYIFHHKGEQLFGGPVDDYYPSNSDVKIDAPSTTHEGGRRGPQFANAVVERIWYTSAGRGIRVSEDTPLFFSQNETTLVLTAKNALPYPTDKADVVSKIDLCLKDDIKQAWLCFNEGHKKPSPPDVAVRKPTLSTWVYYEREISQDIILDFANQMKDNNLDVGILGIDDGWETCYGSQIVNTTKFPDMKKLIDQLHEMNLTVTFWVHPFVNVECEAHERLSDHLVRYDDGTIVDTVWWNGKGALINFLNESTTEFYTERLRKLQEDYGVDGFKFDAGEISYVYDLNQRFKIDVPNMYTKKYVEMAAKFGPIGEVRVGAGTFDQPIRQRLQDTNSSWSIEEHGLKAVIPAMLQLTVLGYGATIPDMVGGNAYTQDVDKELLIRWSELTTFMPNMQFSYPPWKFDEEALKIIRQNIDVHYKYSSYMMDLFFSNEPTPVVAPLWWIDPTEPEALTRNDEFLVGDQILVAPVVEKGADKRDIYFPSGIWLDVETGITYEGPKTIKDFPAPLEKLPWFLRQQY